MNDLSVLYGWVSGSTGALALLIILLFSILLCVVVKKFRELERHFDIGKSVGGHKGRSDERKPPELIALKETGYITNDGPAAASTNPSSTLDPDTQDPSTVKAMYSIVKKKHPPVKVEQYDGDIGDSNAGVTHNPECGADTMPSLKKTSWAVQVNPGDYSRLCHTDQGRSRLNRHTTPLLSKEPDENSDTPISEKKVQSDVHPASHLVTAENDMFLSDVEDPPPPLPTRLSTSLELIMESKETEGESSGKDHAQYQSTPQSVMNEMLYDEVVNTAPGKGRSAYDAPALERNKKVLGPGCFYDDVIL